jgi:outer membrane protein OmpA-like peptidoglycan-associated protein
VAAPYRKEEDMKLNCFGTCAVIIASATLCVAQVKPDVKGSKDHPLLSRYPNSSISEYSVAEFDEFTLPLGKSNAGKLIKSQQLEGKITRMVYNVPAGRSILEVYRNYESALKQGGFAVLYSCVGVQECGPGPVLWATKQNEDWSWNAGLRILSAKLSRKEGDVYVSLLVGQWSNLALGSQVHLYLVETKPMEGGLVTVNAEALGGDITRNGHAAVYGIYFDTGKAEVKTESDAALKEIVKLLQQTPQLKVLVVGHTDNVGGVTSNMDLSKRRADAVVQVLTAKYGVVSARLSAQGVGPLAPVESNDTEDGRAKNRRVELVKQ